jgi:hypothetical protein
MRKLNQRYGLPTITATILSDRAHVRIMRFSQTRLRKDALLIVAGLQIVPPASPEAAGLSTQPPGS